MKTNFLQVNSIRNFLLLVISCRPNEGVQFNHQTTICNDPGKPDHASRNNNAILFFPGDEITFTCDHTYHLVGSQKRTCLPDGTWTGTQPKCEATVITCSDPGTPAHAFREDDLVMFYPGEEVIFKCEYTYQVVGSQSRTCLPDGTWSGIQPKCEVYMCDELHVWIPDNGWKWGSKFTIGSNLTFGCNENYKVKGDEILQCLPNGQWSANPPTCELVARNCSDPGTPTHAFREDDLVMFRPGEEVIFTCEYTYRLVGSQRRTCLSNGTWTGIQPKCKVYMCDELDAIAPVHGWKVGNNYSIGSNLLYECSENYKLKGHHNLRCLSNGQWSSSPPTCEHLCKGVKCNGTGEMCQAKFGRATCQCRSNMDCTSLVNTVCGSDSVTYINDCIMNATGCRKKKEIRQVFDGHCVPGEICSIVPMSLCRASFHVFFYNVTKGACQDMLAGGCHPTGWNGFWSKKECESHCGQDICVLKPEHGPCTNNLKRWYFDTSTNNCQQFRYGGCFGSANNFVKKDDCLKRCGVKNHI